MRPLIKSLFLGCTLLAMPPALDACCGDDDCIPAAIKVANFPNHGFLRGDYLISMNEQRLVVDLMRGKTYQLGKIPGRWTDMDVANGKALVLNQTKLQVIKLENNKVLHEIEVGKERVYSLGFVGASKAFVHHGKSIEILELASGKTLHTINFDSDEMRWNSTAWQIVGKRLFIAGPQTTLCVIDLDSGKLVDRVSIDVGAGIASLHVVGSLVYCVGSPFSWVPNNRLVCYDLETKKTFFSKLSIQDRFLGRVAGGPYGTAFVFGGHKVERITMMGERCGTFSVSDKETVLAVWRGRAVVAGNKDELRLVEIKETPVTRTTSAR
jgi:hypothetical protein